MDNKKADSVKDIDYTIVLDKNYSGPDLDKTGGWQKELESFIPPDYNTASDRAASDAADESGDTRAMIDKLYSDYETMCLKEPTVLDIDDAYPHTYYWRMGDRYDPDKIEVIKKALKQGIKIAETDAYLEYVEKVKNRRFSPDSWD